MPTPKSSGEDSVPTPIVWPEWVETRPAPRWAQDWADEAAGEIMEARREEAEYEADQRDYF